jgi:ATP phosphoribosyltransferase
MGGGIIWESSKWEVFRKRGVEVLNSIQRNPSSIGYVGSDRMKEDGYTGFSETIEPIVNTAGQLLRFALIAQDPLTVRAKMSGAEPLKLVTSYPLTAIRLMGQNNKIGYVSGGIEAELRDDSNDYDAGFELVQSGDSVRQNKLEIVEDGIEFVTLECVRTPYDW